MEVCTIQCEVEDGCFHLVHYLLLIGHLKRRYHTYIMVTNERNITLNIHILMYVRVKIRT